VDIASDYRKLNTTRRSRGSLEQDQEICILTARWCVLFWQEVLYEDPNSNGRFRGLRLRAGAQHSGDHGLMTRTIAKAEILLLTIVALGGLLAAAPQATVRRLDGSTISAAEIDATVSRLMRAAEVTGVGISILNHGKVVYQKAYGFRDTEKQLPLTADSVMAGASPLLPKLPSLTW
jgi:hypothetical protein